MTRPRSESIIPGEPGFYHCVSRCVRRAHLCGQDHASGRDYDHRRDWMMARLEMLTHVFAIDVYAYAIMSNHYHLVIFVDPDRAKGWSDRQVADRWQRMFTWRRSKSPERLVEAATPEQIEIWRKRLGNVSWFMKAINEPLARLANSEDECTGHFWESRFKSIPLLDEGALLACMAYVDLNPLRASGSSEVVKTRYYSLKRRAGQFFDCDEDPNEVSLGPILCGHSSPKTLGLSEGGYLSLINWTLEMERDNSSKADLLKSLLRPVDISAAGWPVVTSQFRRLFRSAAGNVDSFRRFAKRTGRVLLRDREGRKLLYRTR